MVYLLGFISHYYNFCCIFPNRFKTKPINAYKVMLMSSFDNMCRSNVNFINKSTKSIISEIFDLDGNSPTT